MNKDKFSELVVILASVVIMICLVQIVIAVVGR